MYKPSLGTLKVTQQLQWTLMGHWGAVLHITGLLPLQSKRFQQSAAAAIWEEGRKESSSSGGGGGECFLSYAGALPVNQRLTSPRSLLTATDTIQPPKSLIK